MKHKRFFFLYIYIGCLILIGSSPSGWGADPVESIEAPVHRAVKMRQATQKGEEAWRVEREKMMAQYERLEKEHARLQHDIEQYNTEVQATRDRIERKKKELSDIEQISHDLQPYLNEIIQELNLELTEGLPFLIAERRERIEKLTSLMAESDISISEKYRKVMEAMLIEADYGYTAELTQEIIRFDGENVFADIFRLGRLNLFFIRPDGNDCGYYNIAERKWDILPPSHLHALKTASEISARRQTAALLELPIGRIVTK